MSKRIHVTARHGSRWRVFIEGGRGASKTFWNRKEASVWAVGRLLRAGGGTLVVHASTGEVAETWEVRKEA